MQVSGTAAAAWDPAASERFVAKTVGCTGRGAAFPALLPCGGNKLLPFLSQLPLHFPAISMSVPLDPEPFREEEHECIRNSEGKKKLFKNFSGEKNSLQV